jgi:hypothetical protein
VFKTDSIGGVIAGIFLLILVYLLVSNSSGTVSILGTIGSNAISGIKTLQARG